MLAMLFSEVTSAASSAAEHIHSESTVAIIVAICAVCNILIAASQALIIPFVRGVRADVKEVSARLEQQQLSLVEIKGEMEGSSKGVNFINERHNLLQKKNDMLSTRLNDLLMHLAHKQLYTPRSIRDEEQENHT